MTMSTSSAPSSTAARASATLRAIGDWPDGNAVATDATWTDDSRSRARASATSVG